MAATTEASVVSVRKTSKSTSYPIGSANLSSNGGSTQYKQLETRILALEKQLSGLDQKYKSPQSSSAEGGNEGEGKADVQSDQKVTASLHQLRVH